MRLSALSSIHTRAAQDETLRIDEPTVRTESDAVIVTIRTESTAWRERLLEGAARPAQLCREPAPIREAVSQMTPAPTAQADRRRRLCVVSHSSRLLLLARSPNLPCAP